MLTGCLSVCECVRAYVRPGGNKNCSLLAPGVAGT